MAYGVWRMVAEAPNRGVERGHERYAMRRSARIGPSCVAAVAIRCGRTDDRPEVAQDAQPDALALLRVELAGEEVVARDRRDELAAVVGRRGDQRRVGGTT